MQITITNSVNNLANLSGSWLQGSEINYYFNSDKCSSAELMEPL